MTTIYLDNNATTQVAPEVLEAMLPYLRDLYGNPSSMHSFGGQVGRQLRHAREQVAALIGAHPEEIIFTSCGTESDNTAIRSALATHPGKRHIVTTRVEHPAIQALAAHLAQDGYRVTEIPVDGEGRLNLEHYARSLTPDTAVVSAHVGQQRNRGHLPGGGHGRDGAPQGHPLSYRRGAGGGQDPHRHETERH